jgi:hypothetical protein
MPGIFAVLGLRRIASGYWNNLEKAHPVSYQNSIGDYQRLKIQA